MTLNLRANVKTCYFTGVRLRGVGTIDFFLKTLKLEIYIKKFKEHRITLKLLKELPEDLLKETLKELELPLGAQMIIVKEFRPLDAKSR